MIMLPILTTSLINFSFKGGENVLFELGSERVKDALAGLRVANAGYLLFPSFAFETFCGLDVRADCWFMSRITRCCSFIFLFFFFNPTKSPRKAPDLRNRFQSVPCFVVLQEDRLTWGIGWSCNFYVP